MCVEGEGEGSGSVGNPCSAEMPGRRGLQNRFSCFPSVRVSGGSMEYGLPDKSYQKASLVACLERKEAL